MATLQEIIAAVESEIQLALNCDLGDGTFYARTGLTLAADVRIEPVQADITSNTVGIGYIVEEQPPEYAWGGKVITSEYTLLVVGTVKAGDDNYGTLLALRQHLFCMGRAADGTRKSHIGDMDSVNHIDVMEFTAAGDSGQDRDEDSNFTFTISFDMILPG